MEQITVTFNPTAADLNDFAEQYSYQDTVPNPDFDSKIDGSPATISNPESKLEFFIRTVKEFVYGSVKSKRVNRVSDAVRKVELNKVVSF